MEQINLLKPHNSYFKGVAKIIYLVLAIWFLMVYGFQFLLYLVQRDPMGTSFLTQARFLGFPFHYWFTGQFAILGFILLCILFNYRLNRHIVAQSDKEIHGDH